MDEKLTKIKEIENKIRFLKNKVHNLERKHEEMLDEYISKKSETNRIASLAKSIDIALKENNIGTLIFKLDVYEKHDEYGPKVLILSCQGLGPFFKINFMKDYKTNRYRVVRNNKITKRLSTKHFNTRDEMFRYLEKFLKSVPQVIESNYLKYQILQFSKFQEKIDKIKNFIKGEL